MLLFLVCHCPKDKPNETAKCFHGNYNTFHIDHELRCNALVSVPACACVNAMIDSKSVKKS